MNATWQALLYLLGVVGAQPQHFNDKSFNEHSKINKIIVELKLHPRELKDSGKIRFRSVEYFLSSKTNAELKRPSNGSVQIEISSHEPVYLNFIDLLRSNKNGYYLTEPGDEVEITSTGNGFSFSGQGAEKYRLQYQLDSLDRSMPRINNKKGLASFYLDSIEEYFAWMRYYRQRLDLAIPLLRSYKKRMSDRAYDNITDDYVRNSLKSIRDLFASLSEFGIARKKVPGETLIQVYDTCYSRLMQEWIDQAADKPLVGLELQLHQLQRSYSFDGNKMPRSGEMDLIQLEHIIKNLKGKQFEQLIVNRLPKTMIKVGFTPAMEALLETYYAGSEFPEWKSWMKDQELNARRTWLANKGSDLKLTDFRGSQITSNDLKGKIAVVCFQAPEGSKDKAKEIVIQKAIEKYKNRPEIVFVNITSEKFSMIRRNSIINGKNSNATNVIQAQAGDQTAARQMLKNFAVRSFPCIWVLDSSGVAINAKPWIDFTQDKGDKLVSFIQKKIENDNVLLLKMMSYKKDGPYIYYDINNASSFSIDDTVLVKSNIDKHRQQQFKVYTDQNKTFSVQLKASIDIQPSVYPEVSKLLVLSDIEGNFDALRKLLQHNKVIDEQFNWIFGNGHLVFAGDMFDRGLQVTECLWLLYSLEDKARSVGGYVHFVLGNHEIMNMQGNHYYTKNKYRENAQIIGKTLKELYGENSELGRWLRSKNIIEKIGEILFVHGGISPEVNRLPLEIDEINTLARPSYGGVIDSTNKTLLVLYDTKYGERSRVSPFWSRGYYKSSVSQGVRKISNEQLDSTLTKFNVRKIVTGHSIVADTISVHYQGRVINTDTHHANGLSEALLIEGDRYYRVNDKGAKVLLFIDDKIKRS